MGRLRRTILLISLTWLLGFLLSNVLHDVAHANCPQDSAPCIVCQLNTLPVQTAPEAVSAVAPAAIGVFELPPPAWAGMTPRLVSLSHRTPRAPPACC